MDKIELQRLLDGELDHAQRCRLLGQLDERPSQWRMVALALLEEQAFSRELGSLSRSDPHVSQSTSITLADSKHSKSDVNNRAINRWLPVAIAASLLVGIGFLGGNWLASRFDSSSLSDSNIVGNSIAVAVPTTNDQEPIDVASLTPVGQLSFASDMSVHSNGDSVQVPIYEAAPEQFNQMLVNQQQQIQQWSDQLRRRGFELEWRPEMLESRLPDGRAVIVPIQQVNIRNLGQ